MADSIHTSVTPDEKIIATLTPGSVVTYNAETQEFSAINHEVMVFGSTPGQTISISRDGELTAVTGFAGTYPYIYQTTDLPAGHRKLIPAVPYTTKDSACAFGADGTKIYVGNDDGWVRVFDVASGEELPDEAWKAHQSEVTAIAVSQEGGIVATAGGPSTILWSTELKSDQVRRSRIILNTGPHSRNWLHFTTGDTCLIHAAPEDPFQHWDAPSQKD